MGSPFSFTVTAQNADGSTDTGYGGTVHFSSSDPAAALPADNTLTGGVGTFTATLQTAGSTSLTATDALTSSIAGSSSPISVSLAAVHLFISAPTTATAGTPFNFTVVALDSNNNLATGYTGTVHFAGTDGRESLPVDVTLTDGAGTFVATLDTAGTQLLTATDIATSNLAGTSNNIAVTGAAATHFSVTGVPTNTAADVPFSFTVTALRPIQQRRCKLQRHGPY